HLGTRATTSPSAAKVDPARMAGKSPERKEFSDDEINRRIFEEEVDIVVKAWTEDSIEYQGHTWQIPYPHDKGVDDWPLANVGVTGRLGAPGEVDEAGNVRRISVVPAPYTKPHPPVFVATSGSPESAEYAARRGFIPLYFTGLGTALTLGNAYVNASAAAGRPLPLGQNQALVRMPRIASSRASADEMVMKYDSDIFRNFYAAMGRHKIERKDVPSAVTRYGLWTIGTVDEVRDQLS